MVKNTSMLKQDTQNYLFLF